MFYLDEPPKLAEGRGWYVTAKGREGEDIVQHAVDGTGRALCGLRRDRRTGWGYDMFSIEYCERCVLAAQKAKD